MEPNNIKITCTNIETLCTEKNGYCFEINNFLNLMNVINAKERIINELYKRRYEGSDNNVIAVAKESRSIFDGLIYNLLSNRFDVKYGSKLDFDLRQCNFELREVY